MDRLILFLREKISSHQIIFKNTFWLYFSEILSKGLRGLVFLFIAQALGPKNFGVFEYLFSFVGIFFLFSDFGVSYIFIRDYQQKEEKEKIINTAFTLKIIFSIIFGILALFGYFLTKKVDGFLLYLFFVLFYFFQNIENFFETFFVAINKTDRKFFFNLTSSLILFLIVIFGLTIYKNILIVALAYLLSIIFGLLVAYFLFKLETKKISFNFDLPTLKYYLSNGLPLVFFGLLGYIFFSTDKIILVHLKGIVETGIYSAASRVINALFFLPSLFNLALFPYLSRKVKENENINKIFNIFILLSIFLGFLCFLLIFFLAPFLIKFLFGFQYLDSISVLQVFSLIFIFLFPTIFLDYFLLSYNKQWLDFGITLIPAILNIVLNLILIPQYGIFGAVYSSLISQLLNFLLTFTTSVFILKRKMI